MDQSLLFLSLIREKHFAFSRANRTYNKFLLSSIPVTLDTNNVAELDEQQLAWGDIQLLCL